MIDISLLCPEQYTITDLIDSQFTFSKFVTVEADGHLSIEELVVQKQENANKLFEFIFEDVSEHPKAYDSNGLSIYDLSSVKDKVISFETLEFRYQDWIEQSEHENTMDEYGMLIGVIGFVRRNQHRKNFLAVVRSARAGYR